MVETAVGERSHSVHLAQLKDWLNRISRKTLAEREAWMNTQDAIATLGARRCNALRRELRQLRVSKLRRLHRVKRMVVSAALFDAYTTRLEELPVFLADDGNSDLGITACGQIDIPSVCTNRRFAVRMKLSREGTSWGTNDYYGVDGQGHDIWGCGARTRRWTPPQAVEIEDFIDAQTPQQAAFYPHPESISALVIIRIGAVEATPIDGQY